MANIISFLSGFVSGSVLGTASYFAHFEVVQTNNSNLYVTVKPKNEKSRINSKTLISHFQWAVTVISYKGPTAPTLTGFRENHAQLVIEGLDNVGKYFMWMAHFGINLETEKPVVEIVDMSKKEIKYSCCSDVWKIPKGEASNMWESVIKDSKNPQSLPKLHVRGKGSIGVKEGRINCFDWVQEKLEMVRIFFPKGNKIASVTSWRIKDGVSKRPKHGSNPFSPEEENELI